MVIGNRIGEQEMGMGMGNRKDEQEMAMGNEEYERQVGKENSNCDQGKHVTTIIAKRRIREKQVTFY